MTITTENFKGIIIREASPADHLRIMEVMTDWWGGRDLRAMVPRLFLNHFYKTSFTAESNGQLAGFLIGFMSPSQPEEAYVHFMGVGTDYRMMGLGGRLYELFCALSRENGRLRVRACTSPVNRASIAFHQRLGFILEEGDFQVDGFPVVRDYNRPGDDKVRFLKML